MQAVAIAVARRHAEKAVREHVQLHVCVVMKKNTIISIHTNSTHHAEVEALRRVNRHKYGKGRRKKKSLDLFVFRFSKSQYIVNNSKPCKQCRRYILRSQMIKHVYYST